MTNINTKKILVVWLENSIDSLRPDARQKKLLRTLLPQMEVVFCNTETAFRKVLPHAFAALVWRFNDSHLEQAPVLRFLISPAAGREGIKLSQVPKRLKIVHGDFHGPLMAQTLVGALLAMNRGLFFAQQIRSEKKKWAGNAYPMWDVEGTHAVIYGYGRIGKEIARILQPFGIKVTGVRRTPGKGVVTPDTLPSVLPTCDHLILVLPSDTGTDKLINAKLLRCLPKRAIVYNIGRGNCIDEAALIDALTAGRLRGAYLDVFATEPLPDDSPLYQAPNLVISAHTSALAPTYLDRCFQQAARVLR